MSSVNTFRIHTLDLQADVEAESPNAARKIFLSEHPNAIIKKVKLIKAREVTV